VVVVLLVLVVWAGRVLLVLPEVQVMEEGVMGWAIADRAARQRSEVSAYVECIVAIQLCIIVLGYSETAEFTSTRIKHCKYDSTYIYTAIYLLYGPSHRC